MQGHGLAWIHLVTGVALRGGPVGPLGLGEDAQHAEYLEGLDPLREETLSLQQMPFSGGWQIMWIGKAQGIGAANGLEAALVWLE